MCILFLDIHSKALSSFVVTRHLPSNWNSLMVVSHRNIFDRSLDFRWISFFNFLFHSLTLVALSFNRSGFLVGFISFNTNFNSPKNKIKFDENGLVWRFIIKFACVYVHSKKKQTRVIQMNHMPRVMSNGGIGKNLLSTWIEHWPQNHFKWKTHSVKLCTLNTVDFAFYSFISTFIY